MLKEKFRVRLRSLQAAQPVEYKVAKKAKAKGSLSARSLIWVGLGGIIGAGFFLASGLSIQHAGPGVIIGYILGAVLLSQVAGAITSLTVSHPVKGSFRVYAEEFLGSYAGFVIGWAFWISAILGIGSETIAMAIFSRYWLPTIPLWLLALGFSAIVIGLNAFGVKSFGKIESMMSMVKVTALVLFAAVGLLVIFGLFKTPHPVGAKTLLGYGGLLPMGITGVLKSMLIVIFAYSGISIVAMATSEVEDPKVTIPRATLWIVLVLVAIYVASLAVVMSIIPWTQLSARQSPFVTALTVLNIPFAAGIMNLVILIAAFSVMTGVFFSAMVMLASLGEAGKAPKLIAKPARNGVYYGSLIATASGVLLIIGISYLLPAKIYAYLTSASTYFSFLNWITILVCFLAMRRVKGNERFESPLAFGTPWMTYLSIGVVLLLFAFSLGIIEQRAGFYFFLGFMAIISAAYFLWRHAVKYEPPKIT